MCRPCPRLWGCSTEQDRLHTVGRGHRLWAEQADSPAWGSQGLPGGRGVSARVRRVSWGGEWGQAIGGKRLLVEPPAEQRQEGQRR